MGLDRTPEQLIKAGLAALKQKDYKRAIATFQQLSQADSISTTHRLKAQMGLIRTYEAQGDTVLAQKLCNPLLASRSPAIRQWADDKIKQLAVDHNSPSEQLNRNSETASASGFIPETAGFIPFTAGQSPTKQTPPQELPKSKAISPESPTDSQSSLFHYQTLNSRRNIGAQDINSAKPVNHNNAVTTTPIPAKPSSPPPSKSPDPITSKEQQKDPFSHQPSVLTTDEVRNWPQGDRLTTLKSLGKVNMGRLWFAQLATISIVFLVVRWLVKTVLTSTGNYLQFLSRLLPIVNIRVSSFFWEPQIWSVLIGLGVLTIAATWLWPLLLRPANQITSAQLQTYSPEAVQLLRRLFTKRRWPLPKIQLLASELPLIFSYGWRPRYGQLVVSQGLLDLMEPDELATLIMYEISRWSTIDWVFFSTHGLLLQSCHRTYWFFARWGKERPIMLRFMAGALATLSYSIFWLLTKSGCGLARTRIPYQDRTATELTGNPNGLVRALAKLSTAMADAVTQQGYTPSLLESLESMLPVGPEHTGASVQHYVWGTLNPLRHWLSINQAHPPLGDRLYTLSAYGRHWRLKPSLNFAQLQLRNSSRVLSEKDWNNLLLQGGAWSGLVIGLAAALMMWLIGAIATSLDFALLSWLYKDHSILIGIPLICASTGQLLRINQFFPEIANISSTNEKQLTTWLTDPSLIPINYRPIKISGTLTGRPALANWLGQEWRLQTSKSSIKLHHTSYLGPLSNVKGLGPLLHQNLQVTGWFRRGHHLWIDIDQLRSQQNQTKASQHPIWSVITSLIPLSYGLWLLFRGG